MPRLELRFAHMVDVEGVTQGGLFVKAQSHVRPEVLQHQESDGWEWAAMVVFLFLFLFLLL